MSDRALIVGSVAAPFISRITRWSTLRTSPGVRRSLPTSVLSNSVKTAMRMIPNSAVMLQGTFAPAQVY
jgi:hypothetical protein